MHGFRYVGTKLYCEGVAIEPLARKYGTPLYVYSQGTLTDHFTKLAAAMSDVDPLICFSAKANSNQSVLRVLASLGGGFDVVSGGELQRVIAAGGDPRRCVFAGVGKTEPEIEFAFNRGVYSFTAESEPELERINRIAARLRKTAPVAVRVNPDVAAHTHAKITTGTYENKFGIAFEQIEGVYARACQLKNLRLRGLQMHIGSQITTVGPFEEAVRKILPLAHRLKQRYGLEFLSLAAGWGSFTTRPSKAAPPDGGHPPRGDIFSRPEDTPRGWCRCSSRSACASSSSRAGSFPATPAFSSTRVEYVKQTGRKNFLIVDAAMNDLIRPAFYDAYHQIVPLVRKGGARIKSDVVGPICESGDFFCKDRPLPKLGEGDYLALMSAGAYGSVMASNYNTRPLAAEVLVNGTRAALVRSTSACPEHLGRRNGRALAEIAAGWGNPVPDPLSAEPSRASPPSPPGAGSEPD